MLSMSCLPNPSRVRAMAKVSNKETFGSLGREEEELLINIWESMKKNPNQAQAMAKLPNRVTTYNSTRNQETRITNLMNQSQVQATGRQPSKETIGNLDIKPENMMATGLGIGLNLNQAQVMEKLPNKETIGNSKEFLDHDLIQDSIFYHNYS